MFYNCFTISSLTTPTTSTGTIQPKGIRSLNQAARNGTSFPPTGRRRKSPDPDSTQVKLFVRYMPHNKSVEDIYQLFALYGHIHTLEYHTEHKDKLYLVRMHTGFSLCGRGDSLKNKDDHQIALI